MKTVRFISLGCPKNLVDSEVMLGKLKEAEYEIVPDDGPADIFIINTCCFIKEATEESENIIKQAISLKRAGKYKKVVVTGCLPQRLGKRLKSTYGRQIDAWTGVFGRDKIVDLCQQISKSDKLKSLIPVVPSKARLDQRNLRITPRHYAYLRIAEGCDNHCTYCVIPKLHGRYRSKPLNDIIKEAVNLAGSGVKELNLIAQDTTSYGLDLSGKHKLAELLAGLSKVEGIKWIRLLYTHPRHFTEDLIEEISCNSKVVKYIDLPIQHISDNILKKMGRGVRGKEIRSLINKLHQKISCIFLRTSVIVGFPGETEADFNELLEFIKEFKFERLGVFKYSPEQGTRAALLKNQIPDSIKQKRLDIIMRAQQEIAFEINKQLKGKIIPVIIDECKGKKFIGRIYGDAPEVDGNIFISSNGLKIGGIYKVLVTGNKNYDLTGVKYEFA